MIIGLDFDNTIVSYDYLFHRIAFERGLIPQELAVNKFEVRNHLRQAGKEDLWTQMQGYVYGARMDEAQAYEGAVEFLCWAKNAGHKVAIISHKTKFPFLGEKYDLHIAATSWIENNLSDEGGWLIQRENIFFEPTKENKISKISSFECDVFLDDLPEILDSELFPNKVRRFLFDPEDKHMLAPGSSISKVNSWREFTAFIAS